MDYVCYFSSPQNTWTISGRKLQGRIKVFWGGVLKIVLGSSHRSGEATSACLQSRHAPLGGSGGMPPRKILRKMVQICAIWCILAVFWEVIQRQEIYIMYNQSDLKTSCLWIFVVVIFFFWRRGGTGCTWHVHIKIYFPLLKEKYNVLLKRTNKISYSPSMLDPKQSSTHETKARPDKSSKYFPSWAKSKFQVLQSLGRAQKLNSCIFSCKHHHKCLKSLIYCHLLSGE